MPNAMKARREAMMQEAIVREPRVAVGRRFIGAMCVLLLAARVALAAAGVAFVLDSGLPIRLCIADFALLLVAVLFALGIYKMGVKALAYLAMIGGALTILDLMKESPFAAFYAASALYRLYIITAIVSMLIQIASMLLIVLNKNSGAYFAESKKIMKALADRSPGGRLN